jgi:hypothetical protein
MVNRPCVESTSDQRRRSASLRRAPQQATNRMQSANPEAPSEVNLATYRRLRIQNQNVANWQHFIRRGFNALATPAGGDLRMG